MKSKASTLRRLVVRMSAGLLLLAGLCLSLGVQTHAAHAATTLTVSNCSSDSQLQADVSTANSDNAGDTITFSCSGDIALSQTLTISGNMTIDGNGQSVTLDGGLSVQVLNVNSGVSLTLNALTIYGGASGEGGGLLNSAGTVSISNSTFANNKSYSGGGLYNDGGTVSISNSTFDGNSADVAEGGGLLNNGGTVSISNSDFINNYSHFTPGGGLQNEGGTVSVKGSIVAANTGEGSLNNCSGGITDQGYNLSDDSSCGFTNTGSLQNTDPKLDPNGLQNNGGPTQTIALQQGSPAIDAVPLSANICPSTDQRGDPRPDASSETACDMGAYESNYSSLTLTGTNISATEGAAFSGTVASGTYSGSGTLSASINWGDGTSATTGTVSLSGNSFTVSGSHTYAEEGSYSIQVSVNDGSGGQSASATSSATVSDAALTLQQFAVVSVVHRTVGVGATFTDADPAGTISDYSATISWGDGSTSTVKVVKNPLGKGFVLAGGHVYANAGTYSITLTVTDQGGNKISKTVNVTVK